MAFLTGGSGYAYFAGANIDKSQLLGVSIWVCPANTTQTASRILHVNKSGSYGGAMITCRGDGGNYFHCLAPDNGLSAYGGNTSERLRLAPASGFNLGQWYHICASIQGTSASGIDNAFLDGVAMTDTGGGTWGAGAFNDNVYLGARADGGSHFVGRIAYAAVWELSSDLTANEAQALARGVNPMDLRFGELKFFCRGDKNSLTDYLTGNTGTVSGSIFSYADGPPVGPEFGRRRTYSFPTAAGGATTLALGVGGAVYTGIVGQADELVALGKKGAAYTGEPLVPASYLKLGPDSAVYTGEPAFVPLAIALGTKGSVYAGKAVSPNETLALGTDSAKYTGQPITDLGGAVSLIMGVGAAVYNGAATLASTTLSLGTKAAAYLGKTLGLSTTLALGTKTASYAGQALSFVFPVILSLGVGTARYAGKALHGVALAVSKVPGGLWTLGRLGLRR